MSTPAGRACRVITISSSTASRRYLERSSFTSARATSLDFLVWSPLLVEPRLGVGLRDNREDLDLRFCNVIEHPDFTLTRVAQRRRGSRARGDNFNAERAERFQENSPISAHSAFRSV